MIDAVTRDIQGDIPWCMLFADDVVLVDESREEMASSIGSPMRQESATEVERQVLQDND